MLAIKKTLSYVTIFSLMFSNIALASKDLAGLDQEVDALLTSIRPNTFSATQHIDSLLGGGHPRLPGGIALAERDVI